METGSGTPSLPRHFAYSGVTASLSLVRQPRICGLFRPKCGDVDFNLYNSGSLDSDVL